MPGKKTKPKFISRYDEHSERMSIRVPLKLKNHIWSTARKERVTATGVVLAILEEYFADKPSAPKWRPGTTDPRFKDEKGASLEKDVFA